MNDANDSAAITLPTVHLNGTSREELIRVNREAMYKVQQAIKALGDAAPHGRDYYTQGTNAFQKAYNEWRSRVLALGDVLGELHGIVSHLEE